jgi:hypothetical protein
MDLENTTAEKLLKGVVDGLANELVCNVKKPFESDKQVLCDLAGQEWVFVERALNGIKGFAAAITETYKCDRRDVQLLFDMLPVYFACKLFSKDYDAQLWTITRKNAARFYSASISERPDSYYLPSSIQDEIRALEGKTRFIDVGFRGTFAKGLSALLCSKGKDSAHLVGIASPKENGEIYVQYSDIEKIAQPIKKGENLIKGLSAIGNYILNFNKQVK